MMVIRDAQMQAFSDVFRRDFELRAAAVVAEKFPAECAALGPDGVDARVQAAVAKASSYGLREEEDVILYLEAMFLLGPDFDADPAACWAKDVLTDAAFAPHTKAEIVVGRARWKLEADQTKPRVP